MPLIHPFPCVPELPEQKEVLGGFVRGICQTAFADPILHSVNSWIRRKGRTAGVPFSFRGLLSPVLYRCFRN
jgi:hypothetical protein